MEFFPKVTLPFMAPTTTISHPPPSVIMTPAGFEYTVPQIWIHFPPFPKYFSGQGFPYEAGCDCSTGLLAKLCAFWSFENQNGVTYVNPQHLGQVHAKTLLGGLYGELIDVVKSRS